MQIAQIYREVGKDPLYKIWHASGEHMLIFFYTDGGSIVLDDAVYEMRRGTLCFISANCYHYTMPEEPDKYLRSKLFFEPDFFQKTAAYLDDDRLLARFESAKAVCAQLPTELWNEADSLFSGTGGYPLLEVCNLLKLLTWTDQYAGRQCLAAGGFVAGAVSYINAHIRETVTVDGICGAIHMSKYYFCRRFKEMTGLTPMDYVLQTRLALAKSMLRRSGDSIGQVAESCGFSSQAYFCRAFRQATGLTPREYRKQCE